MKILEKFSESLIFKEINSFHWETWFLCWIIQIYESMRRSPGLPRFGGNLINQYSNKMALLFKFAKFR